MSHFARVQTKFVDADALVKALRDVGLLVVEHHAQAQHLYGYQGDRRAQTAEVIIRRKHVGGCSNDIGFKRGQDGTLEAIISDFDRNRYGQPWLDHLAQRYAYRVTRDQLQQQGFTVAEEKIEADRSIRIVLRRVG
jgi:hypothetical protein